ncbi:hypothetical protein MJO28_009500 [Puccinia striiformis f. sp. tritici]|uniref:Uncharacterized protein n=1 Tax=Puccinia striiformis f. sp. tritici TaxID=168172 RepID=A0ACC0E7V0_9BASI|nr:hypothetical protein MJO28_009500 [Puccinia striiformis f. sp. tritici]
MILQINSTILVVAFYILNTSQLVLATKCIVPHSEHATRASKATLRFSRLDVNCTCFLFTFPTMYPTAEDAVPSAISRGSINCVSTDMRVSEDVRPGRLAEAQREISGFPESVPLPRPANQGQFLKLKDPKGSWSLLLELTLPHMQMRLIGLKELRREELNSVTAHLEQLDQYVQAQAEATTDAITRDPQTLVGPWFQVTPARPGPQRSSRLAELFTRRSSKKAELDDGLREIIMTDVIPKFIKLACHSPEKEPEIKLNFLKSLFDLGVHFHNNKLVTSRTMERAEIMLLSTWSTSISNFKGNKLFESSKWVTPQIDLLIDNPSLSHFRRSIQALDHETQTYLVYRTLRSVLGKYQTLLPAIAIPPIDLNTRCFQPFLSMNLVQAGEDWLIAPYTVEDNGVYRQALKDITDIFDRQDEIDELTYINGHASRSQEQLQRIKVLLEYNAATPLYS